MAFTKISEAELKSRGCTTLPNQPAISAQELKEEFDAPAKAIVAPKVNNLIDELEAATAAASLGAVKSGQATDVQSYLDSIKTEVSQIEEKIPESAEDIQDAVNKRHTHANKSVIDKFSEVGGDPYYNGNPIAGNVTVDSSLSTTSENPVQNKVITNALNNIGGTPEQIATAVQEAHIHSNKALLDTYSQTESDLADAVAKKHTHSNKSTLDKLSEDGSGNPTFNGNTIPTTGQTGGFQKFIESDIAPHTGWSAGITGDLRYEEQTDGSRQLYRYENNAWTRVFEITVHAEGSPATNVPLTDIVITSNDIGEGVSLDPGTIVLVVE
jgi:hypothetical protein